MIAALLVALLSGSVAAANKYVLVQANTLSLREKPSTKAKKIDSLITFQPIEVLERKGKDWAKVKTIKGKKGWVLSSYLTKNAFVWVNGDILNVRLGPGTKYDILLKLKDFRHLPLRVLDVASNGWLKIMDYEGSRGWIHYNLVKYKPTYVITRLNKLHNIRKGPGVENDILFQSERSVLFQVLKEKDGWLQIKHADGDTGWISSKIVFGWRDVKPPKKSDN